MTKEKTRVKVSGYVTHDLFKRAKVAATAIDRPVGSLVGLGLYMVLRELRKNPDIVSQLEEDRRTIRYKSEAIQ